MHGKISVIAGWFIPGVVLNLGLHPLAVSISLNLSALQESRRRAYCRFAARPWVGNNEQEHGQLQLQEFEAISALREQNPAFAATLLPRQGFPLQTAALPLIPSGVHWAVDKIPGSITVTVNVAGVALVVTPPNGTATVSPVVTSLSTQSSATFAAGSDGLYAIALQVAGKALATFYVPVAREAFRRLREQSRDLNHGHGRAKPRPSEDYLTRLALLYAANAAAQTNQTALYARLMAHEALIPTAPTPISPYTHA